MPDLQDETRTRRDEWLEFDEENIKFPSPEEIDKLNLDVDFFDVDKFHNLNLQRLEKLGKPKKEEDKRFKFDINQLDDNLFGKLDTERQKSYNDIDINPMYSSNNEKPQNNRYNSDQYEDKRIYASTLKSNGGYDTLSRASDGILEERKSVKFEDSQPSHNQSVMNRSSDKKYQYQSPFKIASKMITS